MLPALSPPKGGGAIRGIGEKVSVNAATGTASMQIPIALSPGRGGAGPELGLAYSSGAGASAFGIGFSLSVPSVTRKTDKGLPRYHDREESDEYILSGAEDLVASRDETGALVELERVLFGVEYRVRRYRPRTEGLFALVERYIAPDGGAHFRVTTKDNTTHIYGFSAASRVADPADPKKVFTWLLEETRDDKGSVIRYDYKAEDGAGVSAQRPSEASRFEDGVFVATAQRYVKRAFYSNKVPFVGATPDDFLMEVVFDYGEHTPLDVSGTSAPSPAEEQPWTLRPDPFSSFRSGFDVRTYRLCRRVLMFHRFTGAPLLVKSTDFTYEAGPSVTYLTAVTQRGYLQDASAGNTWRADSLPPLALDYTRPVLHDTLSALPRESYEGLEGGVDGVRKQWVDLDGEGIPGVLINSASTWLYKSNDGTGTLRPPRPLTSMPCPASLGGLQQLEDLGADGRLDLVSFQNPLPGYFTRGEDGSFEPFRPFESVPNIDFNDPNLRTVDLDGDGLPDLLITEERAFTWYRSRGKAGFAPLERWTVPQDEDKAPAVVFADPEQTIQLADMSGDGLVDIVRIRNGEVCYWPNLGFGRFGAKITLEDCPRFAPPGEFDARRVRFGDVDGSGTSDLFYVGAKETTLYRNQAGNSFAPGERIAALPPVDNLTSLSVVDLLGQGTSTLVWSSPLPGQRPVFYVDLMGGVKPHLLSRIANNLGAETRLTFAPSTRFYLEDKKSPETRWLTRLTFPVHVVEKVERFDHVSQSHLVTTYRYRHGYFDGEEREFRGFARVEQRDAEEFSVGPDTELYQAPVRTVTWFHTGAWLEKERLESALAKEYFQGGPSAVLLPDTVFEEDALAPVVTVQERREAARALRGSMLRQEVYAEDDSPLADKPYAVTEQNFSVRRLQSASNGRHGVFFVHPRESLAVHTERHTEDPRVGHELTLRVDDFGNVTRLVKVAYARQPVAERRPEQSKALATLTLSAFINHPGPLDPDNTAAGEHWHRLGVGFDTSTYELTGLPAPASAEGVLQFDAVDELVENLLSHLGPANDLPFEDTSSSTTSLRRRMLDRKQQLFYDASLAAALPLGAITSLALPYESYTLALTPGLVAQIVADSLALSGTAFDPTLLLSEGGYAARQGGYWAPSGRVVFDAVHFYVPVEAIDAFGNHAFVTWDAFSLLATSTRDSLNNVVSADNDYRVLAPRLVTDSNLNRIESSFDALGLLVRAAVMGKVVETKGDTIQTPTTELQYDLFRWLNEGEPARIHTILREEHASDNAASRLQHSYTYSDGFGRVVMQKVQAEPGEVPGMSGVINPRWVGTGRTIFNNKGNPVKQYEPFFSATSDYESEDSVVQFGVTPIIHYDPVGRATRTDYPDGTFSKVVFDAWSEENWDQNDTVLESSWYQDRGAPSPTGPEPADPVARSAWLAAQHAATPTVTHLDTLGRVFSSVANNRTNGVGAEYQTKTRLDIEGNTLAIFDARQIDLNPGSPLPTITQTFDVLQRRLKLVSADAGTRLSVADAAGKPLRSWDSRGQTLRSRYDALQRGTHDYVRKAAGERLLARTVYGEALDPALAQQNNLRGKAYQVYDCAGLVTSNAYDFKGNLLSASRRLAVAYATEPDWIAAQALNDPSAILNAVASLLQSEVFTTTSAYDALNRVTRTTAPDGPASRTRIVYNEASLVDSMHVAVRGAAESPVISNIDYNARGQRTRCDYQNGSVTTYQYDPKTFRVTQIRTPRTSDGKLLQLLDYTYDAAGNITDVRDGSNWDTALNNLAASGVTGHGRYTYDALYRLVSATGREHPALQTDDADPPRYALPHGNDLQQLRSYVEKLSYDQVGNILEMRHLTGPSNSQSWSRRYQYATNSNRLLATSAAGDPNGTYSLSYGYAATGSNDAGAHGSMTSMPHLAALEWDYADRLKHTLKSSGSAQNTYFTYDASGERVRKVYLHDGVVEERIYLGGYEVYRRRSGSVTAAVQLERQTLHLMDGTRRVLMIETKTVDTINGDPAPINAPRRRYQLDNHLGSSSLELNDTAQVISYEEYHPYGSTAFHSTSSAVPQKRYRYTGKEKDDETGLYYHGARYYAPWLGRWTAADPAGMVDGPNLYSYAMDNPIALRDEQGTQSSGYDEWTIQNQISFENALDQGTPIDQAGLPADVEADLGLAASNPVVLSEDVITPEATNESGPARRARKADKPELRSTEKSQREEPERAQAENDNETVGEPGFAESLIPIWGSGRSAVANFQKGNVGLGLFYSALAVSDVFLVKSLVTVGGKLIVKGAATLAAKEGVALTEKVAAKEVGSIAARESATIAAKETAKVAGESAAKGVVALDTNVIIAALKEGKTAAVDSAIAGRIPIVPIAAAKEFIKANGRAGANALREFLAARGGRIAAAGTEATAEGLRSLATSLGRSLRLTDSHIAAAAMREGVPLITNDKKFFNFLQAIGYAVQKY